VDAQCCRECAELSPSRREFGIGVASEAADVVGPVVAAAVARHLNDVGAGVFQRSGEIAARAVAVAAAGVSVGLPAHAPAGYVAVAGNLSVIGSLEKALAVVGGVESADLGVGVEAHQVAQVAVARVGKRIVFPFRDALLAVESFNPEAFVEVGVEVADGVHLSFGQGRVGAEFGVGAEKVVEQLVGSLLGECGDVDIAVLGAPFVGYFI